MSKRFNLDDIAAELNISSSTVSRVLNDKPGISENTRKNVLKAVSKYNFAPNSSARSLATSKTGNIALIDKRIDPHLISKADVQHSNLSIQEELKMAGYHLMVIYVSDEEMKNASNLMAVKEKRIDGLILRGPNIASRFIMDLKSVGLPIVLFDNELKETELDCILCENRKSSHKITRHLIKLGHREILFLSGPAEWASNKERREGYQEAIEEAGLKPNVIYMPDTTIETGRQSTRSVLEIRPRISAIVAVNDATAFGVISEVHSLGLMIPDDLAITGFDDMSWASLAHPPLTTVHIPLEEMGRLATRRILSLIQNPDTPPVKMIVSTHLVVRLSCGFQQRAVKKAPMQ